MDGELDLKECFGDKVTALGLRGETREDAALPTGGVALLREGELRRASFRADPDPKPDMAGKTATAPGRAGADFFLLEGGIREGGRLLGTGSFSMVR